MKVIYSLFYLTIITFCCFSQGWVQQTSGTTNDLYSVFCVNNTVSYAVGSSGVILKTTNGGSNWNALNSGIPYPLYTIFFTDINTGFAGGALGILLRTTNGGLNWNSINTGTTAYLRSISFPPTGTGNIGYIAVESNFVLKTTNAGLNWVNLNNGSTLQLSAHSIDTAICFTAGTNGNVYRTTNGGSIWNQFITGDAGTLRSIFFTDLNTGWVVGIGSKVYKTTNAGANWQMQYNQGLCGLYSVYFANSLTGWIAGCEGAIHKTTNGGTNWTQQSMATTTYIYDIQFTDAFTGWAVGASGRILKTTTGGITAVSNIGNGIPHNFSLFQNFPNPFNPVTDIKFDIPKSSFVKLTVFDLLGQEVEVLVSEQLNAGSYKADWDASAYTSGIYFYKLQAEDYVNTKRMILIK